MSDTSQGPRPQSDRPPAWRVEGMPSGKANEPRQGFNGNPFGPKRTGRAPLGGWKRFASLVLLLLVVNTLFARVYLAPQGRLRVSYTEFVSRVKAGDVKEISSKGDTIQGEFKRKVKDAVTGKEGTLFRTERPTFADNDGLQAKLDLAKVVVNASPANGGPSFWQSLIFGFGPTLLLLALIVSATRKMGGMGGGIGGFGRSKAKLYEQGNQPRTTFDDVAGIDDAEEELVEIVDFLKQPDKYRALGATIPKGVLLSGPPGTGKTLLARAVAGEANVPFFSMSASEFVEMIVGVGASRVRDLFAQAKAVAPAIIFIDEIDAIGRSRGGPSAMGGHDEREQTLNQILTEMDGFTGSEGVIVLAATNRAETLDAALLRPGRFDRRVVVNPPDRAGREQILRVHTKSVPLETDVDLAGIASSAIGMVGADLKNLVNEAALLAAKRAHVKVATADFTDAMEKIILGTARNIVISPAERERTAFHESGHALLGMLQPGADPVRKISIVPRGGALGVTFQSPDNDRYSYDAEYLRGRITGALGGRAAEEVVYGNVTTGAESDLETVTRIARSMVGRWGMSEAIGPLTVLPSEATFGESPDAPSPDTRKLVDTEVRRIVEECYAVAMGQLRAHRPQLDALVAALLERETLDEADAYAIAGVARPERVVR